MYVVLVLWVCGIGLGGGEGQRVCVYGKGLGDVGCNMCMDTDNSMET